VRERPADTLTFPTWGALWLVLPLTVRMVGSPLSLPAAPDTTTPTGSGTSGAPEMLEARPVLDELFSATYEELRRLAGAVRRNEPGQTLSATALVNETYLKLAASSSWSFSSPLHFKRIAARAMRQL